VECSARVLLIYLFWECELPAPPETAGRGVFYSGKMREYFILRLHTKCALTSSLIPRRLIAYGRRAASIRLRPSGFDGQGKDGLIIAAGSRSYRFNFFLYGSTISVRLFTMQRRDSRFLGNDTSSLSSRGSAV
jgi:hypothetical protein